MHLLTELPSGEADDEGRYPARTTNGLVQDRLVSLAKQRRLYGPAVDAV